MNIIGRTLLTPDDFARALAAQPAMRKNRRYLWTMLASGVLLAIQVQAAGKFVGYRYLGCLAIAPALMLFNRFSTRWSAERALAGKTPDHLELTYELEAPGYHIHSSASDVRGTWASLHHFAELDFAFLFYHSALLYEVVPKRAFESHDVTRVRALLAANVKPEQTRRWFRWRYVWIALAVFVTLVALRVAVDAR